MYSPQFACLPLHVNKVLLNYGMRGRNALLVSGVMIDVDTDSPVCSLPHSPDGATVFHHRNLTIKIL